MPDDEAKKKVDEDWKEHAREEQGGAEQKRKKPQPLPEASFLTFLGGIGGQVLISLGQVPNPVSKKVELDLDQAKYSIDLLEILKEKTQGNLAEEESKYLNGLLYDLRMRYVSVSRSRG